MVPKGRAVTGCFTPTSLAATLLTTYQVANVVIGDLLTVKWLTVTCVPASLTLMKTNTSVMLKEELYKISHKVLFSVVNVTFSC